jgi:hypothetical protein
MSVKDWYVVGVDFGTRSPDGQSSFELTMALNSARP